VELSAIDADAHPFLHAVLERYQRLTGRSALINAPFNAAGEPMVCSPLDAYRCMMRARLDAIVMEDVLIWRHEQPQSVVDAG
jgi:carbamoyltransferase